jgi:flagellar protein FlgJ
MTTMVAQGIGDPSRYAGSRAEAREVAGKFEAMFVQQVVAGMRESARIGDGEGMFGSGPGSDTYTQWFDSYMSEHLARSGGVGVADAILREIERLRQVPPAEREPAELGESR